MAMPGCGGAIGTALAFVFDVHRVVLNGNLGSADCLNVCVGKLLHKKRFPVQLLQAAMDSMTRRSWLFLVMMPAHQRS